MGLSPSHGATLPVCILSISFGASSTERKAEAFKSKGVINISVIGENIKRIRIEKGLTQQQLADYCTALMNNGKKMYSSAVRKYESGVVTPKFEVTQRIAAALGVSLSDLTNLVELSTLLDGNPVELEYIRQAVKEKMERDARTKVLYLCDHRACNKHGCVECNHTTDVRHAKNFENVNGTFVEKDVD